MGSDMLVQGLLLLQIALRMRSLNLAVWHLGYALVILGGLELPSRKGRDGLVEVELLSRLCQPDFARCV
jgi:hypothetical protein